ncbi:MAG: siroheme synthase CysG [Pseudomonadota bacterium]
MNYLPLFIDVTRADCLIVGAGPVALRKSRSLSERGARITVVSPEIDQRFHELEAENFTFVQREFEARDIGTQTLVVAATNDSKLNTEIADICLRKDILVNVTDQPNRCTVMFPSIIERSPITIALSTGGASPVLSRLLRGRLERLIPERYGKLAEFAAKYRKRVKTSFSDSRQKRRFWERVLLGPISELVLIGRERNADEAVEELLKDESNHDTLSGEVYLVGAGPGDPELLSLRALRLMQQADVVVHDRLVSEPILDRLPATAEKIYVGKQRADHSLPQEGINELLVRLAKEGKRVLRLKGGDPFIFGRGGEEIEELIDHQIPFQVVPGITAASGCASYAGIPLTHRDHSQACIFVTGNLKDGTVDLNWPMLAHAQQTVVFYMGLHGLDEICRQLIAHGREVKTPAALIQQGTTENHKVLVGTLRTLPNLVAENDVSAPTLIIVGEVVSLQSRLRWFMTDAVVTQMD